MKALQPGRHVPQGLKPAFCWALNGSAEAVPYPKPIHEERSNTSPSGSNLFAPSASLNLPFRNIYPWLDGPSPRASRKGVASRTSKPHLSAGLASDLEQTFGEHMASLNSGLRNGMTRTKTSIMLVALSWALAASAQTTPNQTVTGSVGQQNSDNAPTTAPLTLTLQDALERAKRNSPEYRAAVTEYGVAKEDRVQSRAAMLPSVNYNASFLYTEGNGTPASKYIANNGVHEYISQGNVHEEISLATIADYRRSSAAAAVARARSEIAARGLVVTVVQTYYGFVVAQRKYSTAQRAATEAQRFFDISQKLEHGGEVAHADVIKAQIQTQQQKRDLQEAELEMNRSRLELAVLVFPDFNENFSV